jgi:hypothetical protein
MSMYGAYLRACGPRLIAVYLFVLFVLGGGSDVASALWLSSWSMDVSNSEEHNLTSRYSVAQRLAVYAGFGFSKCDFTERSLLQKL